MSLKFNTGRVIDPRPLTKGVSVSDLIDNYFLAYNAARLQEGAKLWAKRMAQPDVTITLTLAGALTPAGLGVTSLIPLVRKGFIDFIVSTGAILYHDIHFGLGLKLSRFSPYVDDSELRANKLVRIYDIIMDYDVLLQTDSFFRTIMDTEEFNRPMGSAEIHYIIGKYLFERQKILNLGDVSFLAACYDMGVPIYTSSPGDSSIGINAAAMALKGSNFIWDVNRDVNETAALIYLAKKEGGKTAVIIIGGGSPKNFILQTEPYLQEVLHIEDSGHDYFLQITDARPDTGGLSGALPSEAVSWGKINPNSLSDTVVCYTDATIALPLLTTYLIENCGERKAKRLYFRREEAIKILTDNIKLD